MVIMMEKVKVTMKVTDGKMDKCVGERKREEEKDFEEEGRKRLRYREGE